jgi:hypothetical protein
MIGKRIVALDIGDKRIGVAVSDPFNEYAMPSETFFRTGDFERDLTGIVEIVNAKGAGTIVCGMPVNFDGTESGNVVGVAFVRWNQEDGSRAHYQAVIYSHVLFNPPSDEYQTLGETVEWQTPEITGTVGGAAVCGAKPWRKIYEFPTQAACEAFINAYFAA